MATDPQANRTQAQRATIGLGRGSGSHSRDVDNNTLAGAIDVQTLTIDTAQISDSAITTAKLDAAAVTKTKYAGSIQKVAVADGVDEAAADITITGMAVGDEITAVLVFTAKASIATMVLRPAGDFVAGSGKAVSTANKVDNTNNQYLIFWNDLT